MRLQRSNKFRNGWLTALLIVSAAGFAMLTTPAPTLADKPADPVTGAIQTSVCDSSTVNGNIYQAMQDVYLDGGPQAPACSNAKNLAPDGDWYFQVTDPSGATLLSTDPLGCRRVTVSGGVITGYAPESCGCPSAPSQQSPVCQPRVCSVSGVPGCTNNSDCKGGPADVCNEVATPSGVFNGPHYSGTGACGGSQISIQLFPFAQTPNQGDEYKTWMMPVTDFDLGAGCNSCDIDPSSTNPLCGTHGFIPSDSKIDNFHNNMRIAPTPAPTATPGDPVGEVKAKKFCDANANGFLDPEELSFGLPNWKLIFSPDPNTCSGHTDSTGSIDCVGLAAGSYTISETLQTNFAHTATCVDGPCGVCKISLNQCQNNSECPGTGDLCVPSPGDASITVAGNGDIHHADFGNVGLGTISGHKFDDLNGTGSESGPITDPPLAGVTVTLTGTDVNGTPVNKTTVTNCAGYSFSGLFPGTYTVAETVPTGSTASTATSCLESLNVTRYCSVTTTQTCTQDSDCPSSPSQETCNAPIDCTILPKTCTFGNYCLGADGGLTLGYWSNKNGQAAETAADLCALDGLNLKGPAKTVPNDFDPIAGCAAPTAKQLSTGKSALASWLLSANATNMAYMLSAQLAAMELNVMNGNVKTPVMMYVGTPPTGCSLTHAVNALGFISVTDLMYDANTLLLANPVTIAAGTPRTCQEFVKTALDNGNNNKNFDIPCKFSAVTCP